MIAAISCGNLVYERCVESRTYLLRKSFDSQPVKLQRAETDETFVKPVVSFELGTNVPDVDPKIWSGQTVIELNPD